MTDSIERRDYQIALKKQTYDSWSRGQRNSLVVCPTGGGKSVIVSDIVNDSAHVGMTQCVIAHRNELVSQMSAHVARRGVAHRIVGSDSTVNQIRRQHRALFNGQMFVHPTSRCSVIGVDTLIARKDSLEKWAHQHDQWMVDECHHLVSGGWNGSIQKNPNKWGKAVEMMPNARGLGVTATPIRADGQGLGREFDGVFDVMHIGPSMRELIQRQYLCDYEIVCPTSDLEVKEEEKSASGDWSNQTLRKAAKKSHIVGDVVENYIRFANGRKAIVFATDVETSGEIAKKFNESGIPAASLSAETPTATRDHYIEQFKLGKLFALVNVDLFDEGFDCLDTATEILTPNGWKNWEQVRGESECYAWDPKTGKAEIVDIQKFGMRNLREGEKILEIESQHTSIRVSENHRFFCRAVNYYLYGRDMSPNIDVRTAKELYSQPIRKFALPLCAENHFKGVDISDDEIRIVGWYMTDGYLTKNNSLEISQVKKHRVIEIRELLKRSGFDFKETSRVVKNGYKPSIVCHRFNIKKKSIVHLLPYMNKKNPPVILHEMTKKQFSVLWETILAGNGSKSKGKSGEATTMYKGQADFITHTAVLRGFSAMYGNYATKNGVVMYNMRVRESKWMRFYQKDKRGARFNLEVPSSPEKVWCVTNRLGTLITRRNGRVVIIGNCPSCDVVIMARPTASLGKFRQQAGRALRYQIGKVALIIDMVSNVIRHGLPDKHIDWTLARRDKRAKQLRDPNEIPLTTCGRCTKPYERFRVVCPYCGYEKPLPEPRSRSIEMVEGDLVLLDRATLERMRQGTVLETPASIAQRVAVAAGQYAGMAAAKRQGEKMEAHEHLRETIAQWAAIERERGFSDREIQRKFYYVTGMDVVTALDATRPKSEMDSLNSTIQQWWRK